MQRITEDMILNIVKRHKRVHVDVAHPKDSKISF